MSKFAQIEGHDIVVENTLMKLNYVEEGWGQFILTLAGGFGALGAAAAAAGGLASIAFKYLPEVPATCVSLLIGLPAMWFAPDVAHHIISTKTDKMFKKLLSTKEFTDYIKKECDAIFKEEKKKDRTLTKDHPNADDIYRNRISEVKRAEKKIDMSNVMSYINEAQFEVDGYKLFAMGDAKSITEIKVLFFSTKDDKTGDLVVRSVPVPKKEDMVVSEGWIAAVGQFLSTIFPTAACAFAGLWLGDKAKNDTVGYVLSHVLGLSGAVGGYMLFNRAATKKFDKMLAHPKIKEYLIGEAERIFKEAKKGDKSIVYEYEHMEDELEKQYKEGDFDIKEFGESMKYFFNSEINVGKFKIIMLGDSSELKLIKLVLWSKEAHRIVLKDIPIPSKDQIKEWTSSAE
ncbi:MAG: hypothetical protein J6W96_01445 [Alphaproteobacteria bacterium]|nr:hypothetical protein [Alphaproteobacteria bacterium]